MRGNTARHWSVRALGGAAAVVAALGWSAAPAAAHNYPVGSNPAEGAVVTEQPSLFTVTTNDALLDLGGGGAGSGMLISGPSDTAAPLYYGDGCISLLGPTVETEAQLGQPGEYTVTWQVVSTDGHPVSGDFTFTWQPTAGQTLAEGSPDKPVCAEAGTATDASAGDAPGTDDGDAAADPTAAAPTGAALADAAWIAAALGAVLLAVAGTLLATRRRTPRPPKPE